MDYTGSASRPTARARAALAPALLLSVAAVVGGCGGEASTGGVATEAPRPNVVLVLADTLRADHLGAYGYERAATPRFDALAAEGYLFEEARAQAPCTFPSANSILTGRLPVAFLGQEEEGAMGIPASIPSLAEILDEAGWATAAVSASPIVRATAGTHNPGGGFGRGFDRFDEDCEWRSGGCIQRRVERLIDELPEPFFLYLHYLDPHDPYRPPAEWPRPLARGGEGLSGATLSGDPRPLESAFYDEGDASGLTARALDHLRGLYDAEIAYWDEQLGRLLDLLETTGRLEETIVVVLSDHGESFFEHRHLRHCRSLFDTEIRTPLVLRLPRSLAAGPPRRIAAQAANLDVVPTLLDYLELPRDGLRLAGASLRPAIEGRSVERPPVFASWVGLRAVQDGRYKLIAASDGGGSWLFDLAADPAERVNLAATRVRQRRLLERHLREWVARTHAGATDDAERAMLERLEGLGYL